MILLTSDWHLDENPDNAYRWDTFEEVAAVVRECNIEHVYNLGDFSDRKERFTAAFVNRVVETLKEAAELVPWTIMRGNHDTPLRGPAFWEILNDMRPKVRYISSPTPDSDVLFLPFSPDPMKEWEGLDYKQFKCIFLHATVTGAIAESGIALEGTKLPLLPRSIKLYSGDVHTPQTVRNLTYVGSPHPIKFGDTYKCRFLVIDDEYEIVEEIELTPPRKIVGGIASLDDLKKLRVKPGDSVRIVYTMPSEQLAHWGSMEASIKEWADKSHITIEGTEVVVDTQKAGEFVNVEMTPEETLRAFAEEEEIEALTLDIGLDLLREARA